MNEIKEEICNFGELYKSMHKCKNNVMWKKSVAGYIKNGLINCYHLKNQLTEDSYKIDKYSHFIITEPKVRKIVSTRMKDRVFQKSMCENYLYKKMTKNLIYDNSACQIGEGVDFSRRRLTCHMQRFFRKYGVNGYVLQCDIKNYFGSTQHSVAKDTTVNIDEWVKMHTHKIIESFGTDESPNTGMGLGSQVTQLVQLAVLNNVDHFIKENLKIKFYIRYMDDFILIHYDKEYLRYCKKQIFLKLEEICLKLNPKKTKLYPLKNGIKFLGFRFILTDTGKVIKKINKEKISKERRKLKKLKDLVDKGMLTKSDVDDCFTAWKAHAKKGNTYNLIKEIDKYYKNLWEE